MTKYGAKKVVVDNIRFDSKMESQYYLHLIELQKQGIVTEIELQPTYELQSKFEKNNVKYRAITYKADFKVTYADGRVEVIDVKGFTTTDFLLKAKMFNHKYEYQLLLITYSKIDGGWIELSELKKARKIRKQKRN